MESEEGRRPPLLLLRCPRCGGSTLPDTPFPQVKAGNQVAKHPCDIPRSPVYAPARCPSSGHEVAKHPLTGAQRPPKPRARLRGPGLRPPDARCAQKATQAAWRCCGYERASRGICEEGVDRWALWPHQTWGEDVMASADW